ncbi:plasmid replication initiator [Acetobacter nitrogenifigens DSM 23921 = NBRC 105050]|uniref:Plasmid encoded RepA protein n=1 Tax=Acetobacter nitrogenifigens DSM 23921 = NBRC 105050 TaxID=1120919 RepID=A0A511XF72_9PROT|nr:replication protein RepA [Acetobacter nitrogenifigens]GBQ99303.1 plasmid replication initiator [Acetobacter nitrogenifigens DSM 23921 = NBRC 105050]GEN61597.1 plasmid encoded RepA protein [Acetobacter nitrogenifigens DSM 23921 = NBRC 105050]
MATIHDLLEARGKQHALDFGLDRDIVEAASAYMSDEENGLGFIYSGWAQCALPHRRLQPSEPWQMSSDRIRLIIEPGIKPVGQTDELVHVGVPFGAHGRLILLFLQTEAVRTNSREIELGSSLRQWMRRIGISPSGSAAKSVKDQAERISRCRLTFHINDGKGTNALVNQAIVDGALFLDDPSNKSTSGTIELAKLSEGYFEQLKKHPVPVHEAAVRAISNNSAALDAYVWLAYRLHVLEKPKMVTWAALKAQFGPGYKELFHFKSKWQKPLSLALAVYPTANVEVTDQGLILRPSPAPVSPKRLTG